MVAVIKASASLRNVLNYNENKVKQKVAELIHSNNFLTDTEKLTFTDKIRTIEKFNEHNERTKLKTVHISLIFDPSELPGKEKLQQISDAYMQQIGFGEQPYLVYQHHDAGHPHIHIVSTNIKSNGTRIQMFNIGRHQSEKARRQIEKDFNLVPATKNTLKQAYELKPVNAQKVQYGKTDTRRAITNVLDTVLANYKYSSLPELNAVLKQYNILADGGGQDSRTYKNNGLVYRVLNEKGEKVGTPIKASNIYSKPGLKFLKQQFAKNESLKQPHKQRVKNAIDLTLLQRPNDSLQSFIGSLQRQGISLLVRQNDNGIIYGLTYVDHQAKCVFNGSDIGKEYSANAIIKRFEKDNVHTHKQSPLQEKFAIDTMKPVENWGEPEEHRSIGKLWLLETLVNKLTSAGNETALSSELRQEQIRKRKKKLHL